MRPDQQSTPRKIQGTSFHTCACAFPYAAARFNGLIVASPSSIAASVDGLVYHAKFANTGGTMVSSRSDGGGQYGCPMMATRPVPAPPAALFHCRQLCCDSTAGHRNRYTGCTRGAWTYPGSTTHAENMTAVSVSSTNLHIIASELRQPEQPRPRAAARPRASAPVEATGRCHSCASAVAGPTARHQTSRGRIIRVKSALTAASSSPSGDPARADRRFRCQVEALLSSTPQYLHLDAAGFRSSDRHAGQVLVGGGSPKTVLPRRAMRTCTGRRSGSTQPLCR